MKGMKFPGMGGMGNMQGMLQPVPLKVRQAAVR